MDNPQELAIKALHVICNETSSSSDRNEAQRYIDKVSKSSEGWDVARGLLINSLLTVNPNYQLQFMGARVLESKLNFELSARQLSGDELEQLLSFLLETLAGLMKQNTAQFVLVKILKTLSQTAVLMAISNDWDNVVQQMLGKLQNRVSAAMQTGNDFQNLCTLYLTIQAEVSSSAAVGDSTVKQKVDVATAAGSSIATNAAIQHLTVSMSSNVITSSLKSCLECITVWMREYLSPDAVRAVISSFFDAITASANLDARSLEVCLQELKTWVEVINSKDLGTTLVDRLVAFPALTGLPANVDEELASTQALLVGEIIETFSTYFVDNFAAESARRFLLRALELTNYPGVPGLDQGVTELLIDCWVSLSLECPPDQSRELGFSQFFSKVAEVLLGKLSYPSLPDAFNEYDSDERERFLYCRREIKNALLEFVPLLKDDLTALLTFHVERTVSACVTDLATMWTSLEASLYAVYGLAPSLTSADAKLVRAIFDDGKVSPFQLVLTNYDRCPKALINTLLLVVNGLADFISQQKHWQLISSSLPLLIKSWRDAETCRYGSEALKSFAELASSFFTLETVELLFGEYYSVQANLDVVSKKAILSALFSLLSTLETETMLTFLSNFVIDSCSSIEQSATPTLLEDSLALLSQSLQGLEKVSLGLTLKLQEQQLLNLSVGSLNIYAKVLRQKECQNLLARAGEEFVSMLHRVTALVTPMVEDREPYFELLCGLLAQCLQLYQFPALTTVIPKVALWVQGGFQQTGYACFWKPAQALAAVYIEPNALTQFSLEFLKLHRTISADEFEDLFRLMSIHLSHLTDSFPDVYNGQISLLNFLFEKKTDFFQKWLQNSRTNDILHSFLLSEFIPNCMIQSDRLTSELSLSFASELFRSAAKNDYLRRALCYFIPTYLQSIMKGIGYACPRSMCEQLALTLYTIISSFPEEARNSLQTVLAVDGFPTKFALPAAKSRFALELMTTKKFKRFKDVVKSFVINCRGGTQFTN